MGRHLALVLPGGAAGHPIPRRCSSRGWLSRKPGPRSRLFPTLNFGPKGLALTDALEFDAFVFDRVVEILAEGRPSKVTFIAKSRGTLFLSAMGDISLPSDVDAIWVTPLLGLDYVRNGVLAKGWPSLLVAGSADDYHDPVAHANSMRNDGRRVADH